MTVEADSYEGEITSVNNKKDVTLDVGRTVSGFCTYAGNRARIRISAPPAQIRSGGGVGDVCDSKERLQRGRCSDSELSLIPFPTQDVLINQMASFDLVVFEEFAFPLYGLPPTVLFSIRQKVKDAEAFS